MGCQATLLVSSTGRNLVGTASPFIKLSAGGLGLWIEASGSLVPNMVPNLPETQLPGGTYGDLGIKSTDAEKSKVRPGAEPMYDHFFGQSTNRNEPNV